MKLAFPSILLLTALATSCGGGAVDPARMLVSIQVTPTSASGLSQ